MKLISKKMRVRLSAVAMAALIALASVSSSVMAAPEELSDLARSNIQVAIDFLKWVGHSLEAENIQAWLDDGKIDMDEDLGAKTLAETDSEGNITLRADQVTMSPLTGASRIELFSHIADLAALLVHEKVHAHQTFPNWPMEMRFALSTSTNIWELEAYYREIDVRVEWLKWLIGEYNDEVRTYNPKVEGFNAHAQAITEGQEPDKARMQELLDQIRKETAELIAKKQGIIEMIMEILTRAETLKTANYEKGNCWYDQMKEDWEQDLQGWTDNLHILGINRERVQDWAAWLEQDPPPLPERLNTLSERPPNSADEIKAAYRAAVAQREAWEREADSDKVQHMMPFLERVAATLLTDGRVNLRVYTDVTYRAYYNRVEQTLGIEVRNGAIAGVALPGYATADETVWVLESAILRILIADDVAVAYDREMGAGHIRFEPEESGLEWLSLLLGVLLLLTLGTLVVAMRRRRKRGHST